MDGGAAGAGLRRTWATTFVVAVFYAVVGLATLLTAQYTGLASPLWPAAGLAFALVYQRGWQVAFGVAAGSFVVNSWTLASGEYSQQVVVLTAGAIAAGAALQALFGAALVTRLLGRRLVLTRVGQVLAFLALAGPFACLVNPTVGVAAQLATGVIAPDQVVVGWITWWSGDSIGVIVFAPLTLMLLPEQADIWQGRRWKVAVPSLAVTLVLLSAFVVNRDLDQRRVEMREGQIAATAVADLDSELARHAEVLHSIKGLVLASHAVTAHEFRTFTAHALERLPDLQAVSWDPWITGVELAGFEASQRAQPGMEGFRVTQRAPDGALVPVTPRTGYVIVAYIEPRATNNNALGYDISSSPVRAAAIAQARDSGAMTSTAPIALVQETGSQQGMLTLIPVYAGGVDPGTVDARRAALRGFAVGVYRLGDMAAATFSGTEWNGVELTITDVTDAAAPVEIAHKPAITGVPGEVVVSQKMFVHGRTWRLDLAAAPAALVDARSENLPFLLVAGILVLGLLESFLLLVTGMERAARREALASGYEAEHDPLTELLNRRGFHQALRDACDSCTDEGTSHVLLYLDLDDFKAVNDLGGARGRRRGAGPGGRSPAAQRAQA